MSIIDRTIPRYRWVYNSLKNRIEVDDFKVGDFLPPEPELQRMFNVSRTTVRKAVEMLAQHGFRLHPAGPGHRDPGLQGDPEARLRDLVLRDAARAGVQVTQADIGSRPCPRPAGSPTDLEVAPDARLVRVQRVTLANGSPSPS